MNETQKEFIHLAVIDQLKYNDIEKILGIKRDVFSLWWNEFHAYREELSAIRKKYRSKEGALFVREDFWRFYDWFKSKGTECHYCGISEKSINKLFELGLVNTKRQNTRGRKLEIERIKPNESYSNTENLVSCCYWCNNAKTDEFTEEEFLAVGEAIGDIWKRRLGKS